MSVTKRRIVDDMQQNLGTESGDRIVVHSSLKSMGYVEGGAVTVIEALLESVGGSDSGTLMIPCFSGPAAQIDLRTVPCRLGAVPEAFRTYPGAVRSENCTHSVALIGKDAEAIAATHRGRDPLAEGSPYHEFARLGGYVVHIGCDMSSCSLVHVAESIAKIPYQHIGFPGYEAPMTLIVDDDTRYVCETKEKPGCSRNFTIVQDELDRRGLIVKGGIGEAEAMKIRGKDVLAVSIELLRRDPSSLLCSREECTVCAGRRKFLAGL